MMIVVNAGLAKRQLAPMSKRAQQAVGTSRYTIDICVSRPVTILKLQPGVRALKEQCAFTALVLRVDTASIPVMVAYESRTLRWVMGAVGMASGDD